MNDTNNLREQFAEADALWLSPVPGTTPTSPRCAWCNDTFQMNGSFCSAGCEEACTEARAEAYPDLVAALTEIAALDANDLSTLPTTAAMGALMADMPLLRHAYVLGRAKAIADMALSRAKRLR
jgi:hypothetical protein